MNRYSDARARKSNLGTAIGEIAYKAADECALLYQQPRDPKDKDYLFLFARKIAFPLLSETDREQASREAFEAFIDRFSGIFPSSEQLLFRSPDKRAELYLRFQSKLLRVTHPEGRGPMELAAARASAQPVTVRLPGVPNDPLFRKIVSLCWYLGDHSKEATEFFLDQKSAARVLGIEFETVGDLLVLMRKLGIVKRIERSAKSKAARYRFRPGAIE